MREITRSEVRVRVGRWIAECRAEHGFTQSELARRVGTTQASISNYELARRDIPLYVLLGIIETFSVDPASAIRQLVHGQSAVRGVRCTPRVRLSPAGPEPRPPSPLAGAPSWGELPRARPLGEVGRVLRATRPRDRGAAAHPRRASGRRKAHEGRDRRADAGDRVTEAAPLGERQRLTPRRCGARDRASLLGPQPPAAVPPVQPPPARSGPRRTPDRESAPP